MVTEEETNAARMALPRLFAIVAAAVASILAASGAGLYFAAAENAREAGVEATRQVAEASARTLAHAIAEAEGLLEQWTQEPEFAAALASHNPSLILAAEERLTRLFPGAALVRLLPETVEAPEEGRVPRMGFADLEMMRQAKTGKPLPSFHLGNTPDAHIALARWLGKGNGAILVSLSPKLIASLLPASLPQGALELRQQDLVLGYFGDKSLKQEATEAGQISVPGTAWTVHYWGPASADPGGVWFLSIPALAALLAAVGIYFAWFWLAKAVRHDLDIAALCVRDLSFDKSARQYDFRLGEMRRLLAQLSPVKYSPGADLSPRPTASAPKAAHPADDPAAGLDKFLETSATTVPTPPPSPTPSPPAASEAAPVVVSPDLFKAFGIRGVVGENLTLEVARLIGQAIGSEARERGESTVVIGRDARLSSVDLSHALGRGLLSSGCLVIDLGMVPVPLLYFAIHTLDVKTGVMVAGGDQCSNDNGFKLMVNGDLTLSKDIQALRSRIERDDFLRGQGQMAIRNLARDYLERVAHDAQLSRTMKVVVDCGNGATSLIAPALLEQLGCEVIPLFCEVDGNFPNHPPNPSHPKNLEVLTRTVLEQGADLGVAFDADGDRLGVVDSSGKIIWPDRQLMLFATDVLSREPGADIVYDVRCTRHLSGLIVRNGGRPLLWKTGHPFIRAKMRETDAMLAGEMSGHIFFKERWYGFDDAMYACARLLEILSLDWRPTAEVFAELPNAVNMPEISLALAPGESARVMDELREMANLPGARVTDIDGIRIDFADGWGLVRAPVSQSTLVLRFEGDTPEALERIKEEFKSLLRRVKPNISFPPTLN